MVRGSCYVQEKVGVTNPYPVCYSDVTRQMVRLWHYMFLYLSKVESEDHVNFSFHDILVSLARADDPLLFYI